jgi:hypothetical protein
MHYPDKLIPSSKKGRDWTRKGVDLGSELTSPLLRLSISKGWGKERDFGIPLTAPIFSNISTCDARDTLGLFTSGSERRQIACQLGAAAREVARQNAGKSAC